MADSLEGQGQVNKGKGDAQAMGMADDPEGQGQDEEGQRKAKRQKMLGGASGLRSG